MKSKEELKQSMVKPTDNIASQKPRSKEIKSRINSHVEGWSMLDMVQYTLF